MLCLLWKARMKLSPALTHANCCLICFVLWRSSLSTLWWSQELFLAPALFKNSELLLEPPWLPLQWSVCSQTSHLCLSFSSYLWFKSFYKIICLAVAFLEMVKIHWRRQNGYNMCLVKFSVDSSLAAMVRTLIYGLEKQWCWEEWGGGHWLGGYILIYFTFETMSKHTPTLKKVPSWHRWTNCCLQESEAIFKFTLFESFCLLWNVSFLMPFIFYTKMMLL